jgi:hypothetical protein
VGFGPTFADGVLDLPSRHTLPTTGQRVLLATNEMEIALVILVAEVAGADVMASLRSVTMAVRRLASRFSGQARLDNHFAPLLLQGCALCIEIDSTNAESVGT